MNSKEALKTLKSIIGEDAYKRVCAQMAGSTVYFPSTAKVEWQDIEERNISLREDFYSGKYEVGDLARKYELSVSRVYKIIQGRA